MRQGTALHPLPAFGVGVVSMELEEAAAGQQFTARCASDVVVDCAGLLLGEPGAEELGETGVCGPGGVPVGAVARIVHRDSLPTVRELQRTCLAADRRRSPRSTSRYGTELRVSDRDCLIAPGGGPCRTATRPDATCCTTARHRGARGDSPAEPACTIVAMRNVAVRYCVQPGGGGLVVIPPRNEKVVGSIPTGGSATNQGQRRYRQN